GPPSVRQLGGGSALPSNSSRATFYSTSSGKSKSDFLGRASPYPFCQLLFAPRASVPKNRWSHVRRRRQELSCRQLPQHSARRICGRPRILLLFAHICTPGRPHGASTTVSSLREWRSLPEVVGGADAPDAAATTSGTAARPARHQLSPCRVFCSAHAL